MAQSSSDVVRTELRDFFPEPDSDDYDPDKHIISAIGILFGGEFGEMKGSLTHTLAPLRRCIGARYKEMNAETRDAVLQHFTVRYPDESDDPVIHLA